MGENTKEAQDNWSSEKYQDAAAFVPKLATKIVQWLDVQPDDKILDLGCGDAVLTHSYASTITTGHVHGLDASPSMIETATSTTAPSAPETYQVLDCTLLSTIPALQTQSFTKVFSSAALHWILRPEPTRRDVFLGAYNALAPGGQLVFELGGQGNVAELRAVLLSVVGRRVGIEKAREVDPWFFPDEKWMGDMLESAGFVVERMELEYRPTRAEEGEKGGLEGWMRLMGKNFLDLLGEVEREEAVKEICEVLETVTKGGDGGYWMGYVRLRAVARKN